MKNRLLNGLLVFLTVLFAGFAQAQDITGTVSDNSGPLPGASVVVKGTTNSASTDLNGKYAIKNAGANPVLVFSYIGLASQEVATAGKKVINVVLKDDQEKLKEVLVLGYGSVKRKDATGAIEQISSKKFDNVAATSPAEILRGKLAGVQVTSSSGEPGAAVSIRVRGNSSLRAGNDPLYVIDGVPLDGGSSSAGGSDLLGTSTARNPLNFINQNDIETMTILKDASSTAIYGSRGSNGVILITTKKSKGKEPQLTYNSSVGFSSYSSSFDMMSASEYLAAGGTNKGSSYNWKDAVLQKGLTINNDVAYTSGTENSTTRLSFGANNTTGIVKNTGLDKYTASLFNSTDFLGGYLKIDSRILYTGIKDKSTLLSDKAGYIGNVIGAALYWNPTSPIRNPAGGYNDISDDYLNPVHLLDGYTDYTNTSKLVASISPTIKITNNLKYKLQFGIETSSSTRKDQLSPLMKIKDVAQISFAGKTYYGQADVANLNRFSKTFEHTLNYNKDISDNFNLDAVAGFSYYDYNFNSNSVTVKGFNPSQVNLIDNLDGGISYKNGDKAFGAQSRRNQVELQSYFGRVTANLYKKLSANGTIRRDGGSKLGTADKYANFYSIGLAYKLVEGKQGFLNDVKLRGSYGTTGNQEFAANSAIDFQRYVSPDGGFGGQNSQNSTLKWETTTSSGVGLDFTLLNNKLSGSVDYFMRETKDLLFAFLPESTQVAPNANRFTNLPGTLQNKGLEVTLNYKVINNENWSWDVSANVSTIKNKLVDFPLLVPTAELNGQGLSGASAQVLSNNYPAYSYYLNEFLGYDATGNSIYTDVNGAPNNLGFATKKILDKTPLPTMNVGFSSSASYKNFDASVSFYGAYGHYIYNNTANALFFKGAFPVRNVPSSVASSPQVTGDPNSASTKYLEKGDFLRMGNLTFGYTFRGPSWEKARIKAARFYVNGQNLLLFTDYTGFDPEVDTNKTFNGVPSAGIDYLSYPKAKTISFGVNLTF
jgi:TonB-dependent starch-binding outer membrane protein SusC